MKNDPKDENSYQISYTNDISPYEKAIQALTHGADEEFVPPLHARNHTLQTKQLNRQNTDMDEESGIEQYIEAMMKEEFVLCKKGSNLVGFSAFIPRFEHQYLDEYTPSNYITTIIVDPQHRRKGLTREMYRVIIDKLPERLKMPYVTTRTWSGREVNSAHINLLQSLTFKPVKTIENHRGPGIHTVYFVRKRKEDE